MNIFSNIEKKPSFADVQNARVKGEGLSAVGEFLAGATRIGEQIPRYAGYAAGGAFQGLGEASGYLGDVVGVPRESNPFYTTGMDMASGARSMGEEITRSGEGDITEKQREVRRAGANFATSLTPLGAAPKLIQGAGLLSTAARGAYYGGLGTAVYAGAESGRLPTLPEVGMGVAGGAVLGPVIEKLAIPGISKGVDMIKRMRNPEKFSTQINNETVGKLRQAVRPSIKNVDSVSKFDAQDEKLLNGVKEIVKNGETPTDSRGLMEAIQRTKEKLWAKVEANNAKVDTFVSGKDISTKIRGFVADTGNRGIFQANPDAKAALLKYADDIRANPDFNNMTQDELQGLLTNLNAAIPESAFTKALDPNKTETAKNIILRKIYKDTIDDNLEAAIGKSSQEDRLAWGAVRQLEKDFAKRYGVYLRQNPQGLADLFGMESMADIGIGLLTQNPVQVGKGILVQGVKKIIKNKNNPDTIIADIFKLQSKLKGMKSVQPKIDFKSLPSRTATTPKPIVTPQTIGKTSVGPTTFNTQGKIVKAKTPESPVARELGYTMGVKKPIVKRSADVELKPKELQTIIDDIKNYKTPEEFYNSYMAKDLMDLSNPAKHRFGRLLEDGVDKDTGMYMNAKYTADKYGSRGNNEYKYQRSANVPDVKSENDLVTIYRSTSKKQKEMLPGDFVSFSKEYAQMHNPDGHTLTLKVPAKDVVFQGNDLHEWIYSPEILRGKKYEGGLEGLFKKYKK